MTPNEIFRTAWPFYQANDTCPSCKYKYADFVQVDIDAFKKVHGGECVVRNCGMCGAGWSYQTPKQFKDSHATIGMKLSAIKRLFRLNIGTDELRYVLRRKNGR